jgi:hypothetical protein
MGESAASSATRSAVPSVLALSTTMSSHGAPWWSSHSRAPPTDAAIPRASLNAGMTTEIPERVTRPV